jgi:hypothetical protein
VVADPQAQHSLHPAGEVRPQVGLLADYRLRWDEESTHKSRAYGRYGHASRRPLASAPSGGRCERERWLLVPLIQR